jgi:SSS family solute:Na+ symporter
MAICFFIVLLAGIILTLVKPMAAPVKLPENKEIELESSKGAKIVGVGVVLCTIALYAVFW